MAAVLFHYNSKLRLIVWCDDCCVGLLVPVTRIDIFLNKVLLIQQNQDGCVIVLNSL